MAAKIMEKLAESSDDVPTKRPSIEEFELMSDNEQRILVNKMKNLVPNELKENGWYGPSGKAEVRNRGVSMIPDSERYRVRDSVSRR